MILAPAGITVQPASQASIKVTVIEAGDTHGVDHYIVRVKTALTKKCKAKPDALSCTIDGLSAATKYTVEAMVCLSQSSGSDPCNTRTVDGQGWTKPSSKGFQIKQMMLI